MEEKGKNGFFKTWGLILTLSLSLLIIILDTTMINVSIRDIVGDLDTTLKNVQWAITIYSLIMAAFMLIGGKIGDIYGRKKAFIIGLIIYGIGTLTAALAPSIAILTIGWSVIEGIGAALMMPATVSLLISNYSGAKRKIAFGIWGGVAGAAAAIGPLFGGWMTTSYSWRWGFASEIVIVLIVLFLATKIKESRDESEKKQTLDITGTILSAIGLASIIYGFIEASTYGWWHAKEVYSIGSLNINLFDLSITPVSIFIGLIFMAIFFWWQYKIEKIGKTPLLPISLFKSRSYATGSLTLFTLVLSQMGIFFILPVFLQSVRDFTALDTGIVLIPMSITMFFASGIFTKLSQKIPAKYFVQLGLLITIVSIYMIKDQLSVDVTRQDLFWGLATFGLGLGMVMSQLMNILLSEDPPEVSGSASGIMTTIRNLSGSLGTAIIGTILISSVFTNIETTVNNNQFIPDNQKPVVIEYAKEMSQSFSAESEEVDIMLAQMPPEAIAQIATMQSDVLVDANKEALNWAMIFMAFTFIASFAMPKRAEQKKNVMLES